MRLPGSDTANSISRIQSVGSAARPDTGAFVFVRAEGKLPSGLWSVLVDGKRLSARAERPLEPGALYAAHMSKDGSLLKTGAPVPSSRIAELLASLKLPNDAASRIAVAALMGESLPLSDTNIKTMRRAMARREDPESARLAARALAAGLDPEGIGIDDILPQYGSGHGQQQGQPEDGGQGRKPPTSGDADEAALEAMLKSAVIAALSSQELRTLAAPNQEGLGWLYAPFDLRAEGFDFCGFFRILYNYFTKSAERLVVDLRDEHSRRLVELHGQGTAKALKFFSDSEPERLAVSRLGLGAFISVDPLGGTDDLIAYEAVDSDA
ncbi:MAG TPA: hypothetical protein DCG47_01440 [Spirochaetaceae bacterium]|nr:hypothetical protein [Spirochaetaceae bacterium]